MGICGSTSESTRTIPSAAFRQGRQQQYAREQQQQQQQRQPVIEAAGPPPLVFVARRALTQEPCSTLPRRPSTPRAPTIYPVDSLERDGMKGMQASVFDFDHSPIVHECIYESTDVQPRHTIVSRPGRPLLRTISIPPLPLHLIERHSPITKPSTDACLPVPSVATQKEAGCAFTFPTTSSTTVLQCPTSSHRDANDDVNDPAHAKLIMTSLISSGQIALKPTISVRLSDTLPLAKGLSVTEVTSVASQNSLHGPSPVTVASNDDVDEIRSTVSTPTMPLPPLPPCRVPCDLYRSYHTNHSMNSRY